MRTCSVSFSCENGFWMKLASSVKTFRFRISVERRYSTQPDRLSGTVRASLPEMPFISAGASDAS